MRAFLPLFLFLLSPVLAEEIKMEFHVYQVEPTIGAALEDRLITGGQAAREAMDRLPDFIRQRRVTLLDSIELSLPPDERKEGKSSDSVINLPWHEAVDGLAIEADLTLNEKTFVLDFYGAYTSENKKEEPLERTVASLTRGQLGIPLLLCRWQMDREWLLLVGKAISSEKPQPKELAEDLVFIESAYYPAASSATAGRDRLVSTRVPCLSGKNARTEMIGWIDDENILDRDQPGFRVALDPVLYADGTLRLTTNCGYIIQSGGRTRLSSGERVRRLAIRDVRATLDMKEGELAGRKAELAAIEDMEARDDNWVAAFRFVRGGKQ